MTRHSGKAQPLTFAAGSGPMAPKHDLYVNGFASATKIEGSGRYEFESNSTPSLALLFEA
jgi:hypothetical protein